MNKTNLAVALLSLAFMLLSADLSLSQVPGICTAPDGSTWMETPDFFDGPEGDAALTQAISTTIPLPPFPTTVGIPPSPPPTPQQADEAVLRKWISERTNDSSQKSAKSIFVSTAKQMGIAPSVNEYVDGSATGVNQSHGFPHSHGAPHTSTLPNPHSSMQRTSQPYNAYLARRTADDSLLESASDDLLGADLNSPHGASGSSDPLSSMGPDSGMRGSNVHGKSPENPNKSDIPPGVDPHWEVFAKDQYPSAIKCAACHQQIYDEWRVSGHAYASISPMFTRFEQKVSELTRGTSGTFCMRCHAPVATQMDFPRDAPIFQGPVVFREGITCIACHRVVERYGRVNGERRIEPGSEFDPVTGTLGGDGVRSVIADHENYKVKLDPNDQRAFQPMHREAIQFEQLSDSSFCAGCHQVVVQPGIALEIVYQQYRQGPACKKGVSCQDCHMGAVPGKALGYATSAAAVVNDKPVNTQRKHANHVFYGPSIPLAHPGLFPHNEKSLRWSPDTWLQFDHRQGWGTDEYEKALINGQFYVDFPEAWKNAQERRDARKVVDENQKLLGYKRKTAVQILENGSKIDGPFFNHQPKSGAPLKFNYVVTNTSEGHNMPSGSLGAQPQLWLNVVLIGPDGQRLWESGDLDSNGDLRDIHSLDVRAKKIPFDDQLTHFQTKFLITNAKGTEREMYLPINVDIDPLPFFRPGTVPYTVLNHPPFVRMESHSIPPLGTHKAKYNIPAHLVRSPGTYRLSVRMRSRVEPPYFLLFCDGTPDMLTALNESILDVHPYSTEFVVH